MAMIKGDHLSENGEEFEGKYKIEAKCGSHNPTCVKRGTKSLESLDITPVVEPTNQMF